MGRGTTSTGPDEVAALADRPHARIVGWRAGVERIERWLELEREQIGLWVPVGLVVGIVAWFALPGPGAWVGWVAGCGGVLALSLCLPAGGRLQRLVAAGAVLAAGGCLLVWAKAMAVGEPPIVRPVMAEVEGRVVVMQPLLARGLTRVELVPDPMRADLPARLRINIADADRPKGLERGARIKVRARLMPPAPPAVPGGYDFAQAAWFAGIGATGRAVPPVTVTEPAPPGARPLAARLGAHILDRLGTDGAGAIAVALATGDTGAITEADTAAMRTSGLAHLLSISGLHVSAVIGATIFLTLRLLALSRRLALGVWIPAPLPLVAAGAGALAGIGYTILTGAQVPTVRSCIAALLVLMALALGREAISLRLIAVGAIVVLLFWPQAAMGPSFQMSFLAVAALVALAQTRWFAALTHRRDEAWWRRTCRAMAALLLTGIAVEAALMPIALYHFHRAGLFGAMANLIAIPLTTFVIMPAEALALALDIVGLGAPMWWVAGGALRFLLWIAHGVAGQDHGVLAVPVFGGWMLALVMAGTVWLMVWNTQARLAGVPLIAAGLMGMVLSQPADILVTGDGHHVALRRVDGTLALLRPSAGDYVRDALGAASGIPAVVPHGDALAGRGEDRPDAPAIAALPGASCGTDLCHVRIRRAGRLWDIVMVRSRDRVPWRALVDLCAGADIVIADRRLPRACTPRWLRLDREELARRGGVAVYLRTAEARFVRDAADRHPWISQSASARPAPQL